jgi:hypothetical protein
VLKGGNDSVAADVGISRWESRLKTGGGGGGGGVYMFDKVPGGYVLVCVVSYRHTHEQTRPVGTHPH